MLARYEPPSARELKATSALAQSCRAVISVMLTSGRALEAWAAQRARNDLSALLARAPRTGRRYRDGSLETVPLDQIAAGDVLLVAVGDVVPVDGTLTTEIAWCSAPPRQ